MKNLTPYEQREIRLCTKFHGLSAAMRRQSIGIARSICLSDPAADFLTECKRDIITNSVKHPESIGFTGNRHTRQDFHVANYDSDFTDCGAVDFASGSAYQSWARNEQHNEDETREEKLARQRQQFDALPGVKKTMRTALVRMRKGLANEKDARRWMPEALATGAGRVAI